MNLQAQLQEHFRAALSAATENRLAADELTELLTMIRPSQDPKFGDYQANCAMPLGKKLGRPPREVAAALVEQLVARPGLLEMCGPPETAGPGFINLRLRDEWLSRQLAQAFADPRLGIEPVATPQTYLVDFSSPNVAKPMHVGHVRSTVIGDALYRVLKYLGHRAIGDNHLGDWGTQFGMIIYGWKHFRDEAAFQADAVAELSRLYRLVSRLVNLEESRQQLPKLFDRLVEQEAARRQARTEIYENEKKRDKALRQLQRACDETSGEIAALEQSLAATDRDPQLATAVAEHPDVGAKVLEETAKLHTGDPENLALWKRFLPPCVADIDRIYRRLGVSFDETLGESFYHSMLAGVVQNLLESKIARRSEGAVGVFFDDQPGRPPLLIQKQDGAFLYATTDLATIQYRLERWQPDAILYVVDHRQSLHFEQLFKTARQWLGLENVELVHVSFGTVLGDDGRPFKTRSGDTVGLWGLLDEAVARALAVVSANDDAKTSGPELSPEQRQKVAEAVGIGAIKYADLTQNRTSDYVFSYDKMLAMTGNTAAYMQYAHARVRSIFARGQVALVDSTTVAPVGAVEQISIAKPAERALALEILRFEESLAAVVSDYRPNHLTNYLFALAGRFSTFYEQCPVLKAETPELQRSRLALCEVTARTLRQGLALLGIDAVDKM
jgi:arginyl-tRNA synthetase